MLLGAVGLLAGSMAAKPQEVARAGAVNPSSTLDTPGGRSRRVEIGTRVLHGERVATSAEGAVQLIFIDRSTINIGPNSSLVIDDFVYDPSSDRGRMTVSLTRGLMRLVGGEVTHRIGGTVITPAAVIGVRGGSGFVEVKDDETVAANIYEQMTVSTKTAMLRLPQGMMTRALRDGRIAPPVPIPPGFLASLTKLLAPAPATKAKAAAETKTAEPAPAQTAAAPAPAEPAPAQPAAPTTPSSTGAQSPVPAATPAPSLAPSAVTAPSTIPPTATPAPALQPVVVQIPSSPPVVATVSAAEATSAPDFGSASAGTLGSGTVVPLTASTETGSDGSASSTGGAGGSPGSGAGAASDGEGQIVVASISGGSEGVGSSGSDGNGPEQSAGDTVGGGGGSGASGGPATTELSGGAGGAGTRDSAQNDGTAASAGDTSAASGGSATTDPSGGAGGSGTRVSAQTDGAAASAGSADTDQGSAAAPQYQLHAVFTDIDPGQGLSATMTVAPSGATRAEIQHDTPANAQATAVLFSSEPITRLADVPPAALAMLSDEEIFGPPTTMGSDTADATPKTPAADGADTGEQPTHAQVDQSVSHGGTRDGQSGHHAAPSATDSATTDEGSGATGAAIQSATNAPDAAPGQGNGTRHGKDRSAGLPVTSGVTDTGRAAVSAREAGLRPGAKLLGVKTCRCEFMTWGFWATKDEVAALDRNGPTPTGDRLIGTWVAGRKPDLGTIPEQGSATYRGHAIAAIDNAGVRSLAAGSFTNQVDFGQRTGAVSVSGLDNADYAGTVQLGSAITATGATATSPDFAGTLSSQATGRSMTLDGSFFASSKDPVQGMGGTLTITGPGSYTGSGTFAATRMSQ